ncbi:MAG: hypothetical protein JW850_21765 [Thermoflexales bacterium]|nr:hypothetical protein [Thermoflexales bacterium]
MSKTHITTEQLNKVYQGIADIYRVRRKRGECESEIGSWRATWSHALHRVYKPSRRIYANRLVADLAIETLEELHDALDTMHVFQGINTCSQQEIQRLQDQVAQLAAELERKPQTMTATIPAETVQLRSELQAEIVRLVMGEGLGRSWPLIARLITSGHAQNKNGVRNAIKKLIKSGLLDDYREKGRPVGFSIMPGGSRRLVVGTDLARTYYRQAFGKEPVESELYVFARKHQSITHAVAILEVRDILRAAGHQVDDDPDVILADAQARWNTRVEPDLMVTINGQRWPVEVQREASERFNTKWRKVVELTHHLALVLFNEDQLKKQIDIFSQASLPAGEICLTSLEAMQSGRWAWRRIR